MKLLMHLRRDKALALWFATLLVAFLASTVLTGYGGGAGGDDAVATSGSEAPAQTANPAPPTVRGTPQGTPVRWG